MPNARGEITNRDVRIMRELRAAGNKMDVWDCPVFVDGSGGLAEQGLDRQF